MLMSSKIKAYSVQGNEYGTIRFAASSVVARREGANELDCEFTEIETCRRIPELDSWQEKGSVPIKHLMEHHGWHQECGYCSHHVYAENPGISWNEDETQSYCDAECHARHENMQRKWEQEKRDEQTLREHLIAAAVEKFPEISCVMADPKQGQARFDFPGCTGQASWKPGSKEIWVNACDMDAWQSYRAKFLPPAEKESS